MIQEFNKISSVKGELELPGDKSISHRAVMFSAMAKGESKIVNLSNGEDVKTTQSIFKQLGAEIVAGKESVKVKGVGFKGFQKPKNVLDAGNSGTTTRLVCGILAAQNFTSEIIGDESLSLRPMKRVITPLSAMGGKISASENFTLPLKIFPADKLNSIKYELPIASAQIKSAVILAGLHIEEETIVVENIPSRDHTERMLGLKIEENENQKYIYSSIKNFPEPKEYFVPSDISTAAFFIILTLLISDSELMLMNISLNPSRTGVIDILNQMGANIQIENEKLAAGEIFGDLIVRSSSLTNIEIKEEMIPNIIDEIPILSVAGLFAEGKFEIRNAKELRGKESDRIAALCENYKKLGLVVNEFEDGFSIDGEIKNNLTTFESYNDHRIAMAFSVLSLLLKDGGKINNFECVGISNPKFLDQLKQIIR